MNTTIRYLLTNMNTAAIYHELKKKNDFRVTLVTHTSRIKPSIKWNEKKYVGKIFIFGF